MSNQTKLRLKNWTRLSVLLVVIGIGTTAFYLSAVAVVQNWDFSTSGDYTCEGVACPSTNIQVDVGDNNLAELVVRADDFVHDTQIEYAGGTFDASKEGETEWSTDHVRIKRIGAAPESTRLSVTRRPLPYKTYGNDILAYYNFDEASTSQVFADVVYDDVSGDASDDDVLRGSATSPDGRDPASPSSSIGTAFGNELQFNSDRITMTYGGTGGDYGNLTVNAETFEGPEDEITVSFWFNSNNTGTRQMIYKQGGTTNGFAVYIEGDDLECSAWSDAGDQAGDMNIRAQADDVLSDSTWFHVACVFDSGSTNGIELYLDGAHVASGNPTEFSPADTVEQIPTHTGDARLCDNDGYFNDGVGTTGTDRCRTLFLFDDFGYWHHALTAGEIRDIATRTDRYNIWHLDETTQPFLDSGNNDNRLTVENNTTDESGQTGMSGAQGFNGSNSYLDSAASPTFNTTDALTLQAWIYPTTMPGSGNEDFIISSNGSTNEFSLSIEGQAGGEVYLKSDWGAQSVTGTKDIQNTATWYHVAAVWNQGNVTLFVDGVPEQQEYSGSLTVGEGANIRLGNDSGATNAFNGRLDEVILLTRPATDAEIVKSAGAFEEIATYESPSLDASVSKPWNRFRWTEDLQYGPPQSGQTNLVHLYSLDEATPLDGEGSNDMTATGTARVYSKWNRGHYFDAANDDIVTDSALSSFSEWTFGLWVRFEDATPAATETILSVGTDDPTIERNTSGNILVSSDGSLEITSARTIEDTRWHHLAVTYGSTNNLSLYIDGVLDTSDPQGGASEAAVMYLGDAGGNEAFLGHIEEVVVFDAELDAATIANHYKAQKNQLKFLTRSCNDSACAGENYIGDDGNDMMVEDLFTGSTQVAYWHFDEDSYNGTNGEVVDLSFNDNDGTADFASTVQGGLIKRAAAFSGEDEFIEVDDDSSLQIDASLANTDLSIEAWLFMNQSQVDNATIVAKRYEGAGSASVSYALEMMHDQRLQIRLGDSTNEVTYQSNTVGGVPVGEWTHVMVVYDGSQVEFYINGEAHGTNAETRTIAYDASPLYIGDVDPEDVTRPGYKGKIDLLIIYDDDQGANAAANFADYSPYNFKGDESDVSIQEDVNNRFFQYKAFFMTDGGDTPELNTVLVRNATYSTLDPYIENASPWAYDTMSGFVETPGGSNAASFRYILKDQSGGTYQYWDGGAWENSDATWAQANTAADINTNIGTFPAGGANGRIYWRALIRSDGEQLGQLNNLSFTIAERLDVTGPIGQTFDVDDVFDVTWTYAGDPVNVDIEWSTGSGFTSLANDVAVDGATNGCTDPGAFAGCWRGNIPDAISAAFDIKVSQSGVPAVTDTGGVNTVNGKVQVNAPGAITAVVGDTLTVEWVSFGTIGVANDTQITLDSVYAGSNFTSPGVSSITTSATNDNNGFGCTPPSVTAPQYGGCYEFTIPDGISAGADARVRITEGSWNAESVDFTITGSITLVKPAASDVWLAESDMDETQTQTYVEWDSEGSIGTLILEFDETGAFSGSERIVATGLIRNTNNGTSCTPAAGNGCYVLSGSELPRSDETTVGDVARFRLRATTPNPDVESVSEPQFEVRGWYNITSPIAATSWNVGASEPIQWETHGESMGNIDLEYRENGGAWQPIVTNISDDDGDSNSYTWTGLPDANCDNPGSLGCSTVEIRIKENDAGPAEDISDNFTILPVLSVTEPGATTFEINDASPANINWTRTGSFLGNVDIYYSTDGDWGSGCTASTGAGKCLVCTSLANTDACTWASVPDTPSLSVKFRAEANMNTAIFDNTVTNTSIHGMFSVNLPPCAPDCISEDTVTLTYSETSGSANIANVAIYYSTNDFASSTLIDNGPNDSTFDGIGAGDDGPWFIPQNVIHDNVRIRVADQLDTNFDSAGDSSGFNTVVGLRLISPNGGEEWRVGETQDIQWGYTGTMSSIGIFYCTDGTITCSANTIVASFNSRNIVGCTSPSPGPNESVGCFRWQDGTTTGVGDVRSDQVRIFLQDVDSDCNPSGGGCTRPTVDDGADANHTIMPALTVISPSDSGLKIDAASSYTLEWDSQGNGLANVELFYSDDGVAGTYDGAIGTNPHSNTTQAAPPSSPNNSYSWTTPSTVSTASIKYAVRVQDPDTGTYPNAADNSDNEFDLVARFDPTAPAGAETWMVLTNQTLDWTPYGDVTNVQIQYSNDLITWTTIVQDSPTQGESATTASGIFANASRPFTWKVPNVPFMINDNVKIRLLDADTGHVLRDTPVESNAFNVAANITIEQPPEAGVKWRETQTRIIRWTMKGHNADVFTVDIEYDQVDNTFSNAQTIKLNAINGINTDNGGCLLAGIADPDEDEGCFAWTIPGSLIDDAVWIRVKDSDSGNPDSTVVAGNGVSSSFEIFESSVITVQSPNGATYAVDDTLDIVWSGTGDIEVPGRMVEIRYTLDEVDYTSLANVLADFETGGCSDGGHLGCYRTLAPDDISTTFKIEVRDQTDAEIFDLSTDNTINGAVDIVAPTPGGGTTYVVGDTLTVQWIVYGGTIGLANDTVIELDTIYSGSNFTNPGLVTITSSAQNNANGFGCSVPVVTPPQYGGCYEYTLPDALSAGADMRVRVTDGSWNGTSGDHTLTGRITMTEPTGADVWKVETPNDISDNPIDIEWTYDGTVGTVDLYIDDEGNFSGSERQIISGLQHNTANGTACTPPAGGGCYRLSGTEVPEQDETTSGLQTARFRLKATTPDPDVESSAEPQFEIRGWYDLTQPTNTDLWLVGETTRQIQWETHGDNLGNIDLEYRLNGGSWQAVAGGTNIEALDINATASHTWPAIPDADCAGAPLGCALVEVRIKQNVGSIEDISDNFTIKPQVLITDPSPLNFLIGDLTRSIDWTLQGTVDTNVDIFYSTDQNWGNACNATTGTGKCPATPLCSAAGASLSCDWDTGGVPDIPSLTVKFLAEANSDPDVETESGSFSSFHGNFSVNLPPCAPNCFSENDTNISWSETTGSTNIPIVKLAYSTNDFASSTVIDNAPNDDEIYDGNGDTGPWTIPENIVHDNLRVSVVDVFDTNFDSEGRSTNFNSIAELRMISPNGGESWAVGVQQDIQWGYKGTLSEVDILYCTDGTITCGGTVIAANVSANNAVGCTPPTPGTDETVGCHRWDDTTSLGVADAVETQVRVFVRDSDTLCNPNDGSCGTRPKQDDGSDTNVTVMPNLTLVSPSVAATKWDAETPYNVEWDSQGTPLANVNLLYQFAGGGYTNDVPPSNPTGNMTDPDPPSPSPNNSYSWTTPATISTASNKYSVRVQNPDTGNYPNSVDDSDNEFDIVARFDPTAPAGSESWRVLTNQSINWTPYGTVTNVQIQYSNDSIGWTTILQETPTQGESATTASGIFANASRPFTWKVPNVTNIINGNVKVRVLDADTGHILRDFPVESSAFNVVPNIVMLEPPQSGVIWRETQTRVIRWKMVGDNASVGTVDIEYDLTDNTFSSPVTIKTDATNGTNPDNGGCTLDIGVGPNETEGCFAWAIPALLIDPTVWIRVKDSDAGHPDSTAVTGNGVTNSFELAKIGSITLVEPIGETYVVDDTMIVRWDATGSLLDPLEEVYIEYTTNGSTYHLLAQNVDADGETGCTRLPNTGCFAVSVPDAISTTFQVNIRDQNDIDISNEGGNNTINGNVVMQAPSPSVSNTYVVGDTLTIQWVVFGETIGMANDTVIEFDSNYAGSNFTNPGLTTITSTATNDNNGFGCSVPVVSSPQVGGCYEWTLPDEITADADFRVRVSEGAFNGMTTDHTLTGSITITSPTGADVWKVETANDYSDNPIDVEWTYTGTVGTLDLDFDDTGAFSGDQRTIANGLAYNTANGTGCTPPGGGGCYRLSGLEVPEADETTGGLTTAKFRLRTDGGSPSPQVTTNVGATPGFEVRGWFDLTAPVNTDTWLVGETTRQVSWETHGDNVGNVDIEYQIDGGAWTALDNPASINVFDEDISSVTSYTWSAVADADCAPLALGCNNVKVRVKQTGAGTILAESQAFTIKPQVLINDPAPLNMLIDDNSRSITWSIQGTVDSNVDIFYSTDQNWGNSCVAATGTGKCSVCSAASGAGTCAWPTVPDVPSLTVKFLAEATTDSTVSSESASNARIHANFVPDLPACAPTCFSEDTTDITWSETTLSNNVANVKIFYSTNGSTFTLIDTTTHDGAYDGVGDGGPWFIPENLVSDNVTIRVVDDLDTATDSAGDSAAFITPARLRVDHPNGGEIWAIGDVEEIRWGFTGTVANIAIKYCTDGTITCGGGAGTIAASVAANNTVGCTLPTPAANETVGCYSWTDAVTDGVADVRSPTVKVFLEDIDATCNPAAGCGTRPTVDDGSDANLKFVAKLDVTTPAVNAQLDADTATDIIWDSQASSFTAVDLVFSDDNGSTFSNTIELGETNVSIAADLTSNTANPQWTTPADVSDTGLSRLYQVRVRDPNTTDFLEANSTVPVDIVAAFSYNQPTSSAVYLVGENYTIDWNTAGNVTNVELQYFTTQRGSWTTIVQTGAEGGSPTPDATNGSNEYANDGTFVWQVPNVINLLSTGAKVRVIDGDTGHVLRSSPNESDSFTIIANIDVLNPAGSETLNAGETFNIQWKTAGTLAAPSTVDIEYDLNSADTWTGTVATDLTNGQNSSCTLPSVNPGETAGCYEWQLHANAIHADVRFRIVDSDAGHPASTLISTNGVSNSFTIQDNIVILSPNALNEQLTGGDQYDIKWEAFGSWANVDIQYSNDGFTLSNLDILLSATHDANGSGCVLSSPGAGGTAGCYRWDPIDNNVDANYVIRFREDQAPTKAILSAQTFEIVGPLALTYPNGGGGQYFTQGDLVNITWSNNTDLPIVPFIDLEYSPNNGSNWYQVLDNLSSPAENIANSGSGGQFEWEVPDNVADQYMVRVIENNNPAKGDESNGTFKVIGSISLTTLQGADDQYQVTEVVPISFTVDGTPQGGIFDDVTIRYSDTSDFSANVVNITTAFTLDHQSAQSNCTALGVCTFNWTVADTDTITNTEVYYIQVLDEAQTEGASTSSNQFQVYGAINLSAEHPCGGDNLCFIGETPNPTIQFTIDGTANGSFFDDVHIQYSDDGFTSDIKTIESNWALNGVNCPGGTCTYTWNITQADNEINAAPAFFLRVIDPDNNISVDTGTTAFEIAGRLVLTTINGGGDDVYLIGDTEPIVFTKDGNAVGSVFDDVVIEYSTQSNFSSGVVTIDGAFALDGVNCPGGTCTKNWAIDNTHSVTQDPVYYIRVRDPNNADSTTGTSADQFELAGSLDITILNGGGNQVYKVGDNVNITWDKKGEPNSPIFDDVIIEYSDDGFGPSTYTIDTVTLASVCVGSYPTETCTYSWLLDNNDPIITTEAYDIRIRDPNNTDTVTTTTDQFKIAGDLTMTTLSGGDAVYEIGQVVPVQWSQEGIANGTIFDDVNLQYSDDGFSSNIANIAIDLPLTSVCSAGNCTYNWTVDDTAVITNSAVYQFRVQDIDNPNDTVSISANEFQLAGHLNLVTQTTSATYLVGQTVPITFDWNGDAVGNLFNDVDIEYSNNNFVSDFRNIGIGQSLVSPQNPFFCNATQCTYNWTIPTSATLSSGFIYRLRVMDPDNSDASSYSVSLSSGFFKLTGGFTWIQPTGGATKWPVATTQTAEWSTVGGINNVKVSYSTDDFLNQTFFQDNAGTLEESGATTFGAASAIANNPNDTPSTTSYPMLVPDAISTNFKLRVYDSIDGTVLATSDVIKVHSVFTVTEPDTTTKLAATTYNGGIQWSNTGTVNRVKVEYNLGSGWNPVTSAQSGGVTDDAGIINTNPGTLNWTTPNSKAASAQVRVSAGLGDNSPDLDTSGLSSNFKISAKVNVLSPNGENSPFWKVGDTSRVITWSTIPTNLGGGDTVDILMSTAGAGGPFNLVVGGDDTANSGTFSWNPIPDSISNNVFLRVQDSADVDGVDTTDAAFSIAGDLSITSGAGDAPLGGESWAVYAAAPAALAIAQDIRWSSTGTAMNLVEIRASNDGFGSSDVQIATGLANAPGQNTYTWQISDSVVPITDIGANWQIKVLNITANTPAEEVISDGFTIRSGLYVSSHNAVDDSCEIGGSCTITWDTAGDVTDVILEYSTNGASGPWTRMHGGGTLGSNPGTYNWTVPGALSPGFNARYRVTDAVVGHPVSTDISDSNSRLIAIFPSANIQLNPSAAVLGGQNFYVGETITVDYTYVGVVGAVNVEITLDEDSNAATFDNPTEVISSEPTNGDGTGQFSYQFTDLLSGGADTTRIQFRILDASVPDDSINNVTNGVSGTVSLGGVITITDPNAGTERWAVGSAQTITWGNLGNSITNVDIEYDDNPGFTTPTTIASGVPSVAGVGGSHGITVNNTTFPDINTLFHNDIFIRVSDADTAIHGPASDVSDNGHLIIGVFDMSQGTHAPLTGDTWELLTPQTITWTTTGNITNFNMYYSHTGLFGDAVLINDQITSGECPGGAAPCTNTPDGNTSVSWTPAVDLQISSSANLWLEDADDNTTPQDPTYVVQTTSQTFELYGTVTLTAPLLDAQKLKAEGLVVFTWNTVGDTLNNVDIEYSRDSAAPFTNPQPIAMNYDNSVSGGNRGTYSWTIPNTFNDDTVYVRVRPTGFTNGFDVSGSFKIMPDIQVLSPSGGELWEIGLTEDITWDIKGVVNNIKIRYSVDGGIGYPNGLPYEIVTLNPNNVPYALSGANAKYTWVDATTSGVADTRTNQAKIMIENLDDPSGDSDDEQTGVFTIAARFVLSAPTVNEEFQVGDTFNVQWDWGGTIANVVLEYSDTYDGVNAATFDAGARCILDHTRTDCDAADMVVVNGVGASGTNFVPAPITVGDDISRPGDPEGEFPYYVRISDPSDSAIFDIFPNGAGNGFKIKSNMQVTAPDLGTEVWFVGNLNYNISWTNTGTVDNVVLEYTKDNWTTPLCVAGGTYPACNSVANSSPYSWQIADDDLLVPHNCNSQPDPNTTDTIHPCKIDTVRVRVKDSGDANVLDASDNDFTARYVAKRWIIRDSTVGTDLDSITMFENSIHKVRAFGNQNVPGIVSPYVLWSPANVIYTIAFQKTGFTDLFDTGQITTSTDQLTGAGDEMVDEEQTIFLDSIIAHNDIVNTSFEYTPGVPDQILFTVWYTRDGLNVTTTQGADLHIYDGPVEIITMNTTTQTPPGSGVYEFLVSPSGLLESVDYEARNTVTLASNAQLPGYSIINITSQSQSQDTSANLAAITPVIETNLDTSLDTGFTDAINDVNAAKTTISTAIGDTSTQTLKQKLDDQGVLVDNELDLFEDSANDAIAQMQDQIDEAGIRLIIPDTVKIGSIETLRLSTVSGKAPVLDISCPDNTPIFQGLAMAEVDSGLYAVDVNFDSLTFKCAAAKAVTVQGSVLLPSHDINDPAFTATAIGGIFITTTDLDTIQGLAAAGLNAEKAAKEAKEAIESVSKAVTGDGSILDSLTDLQRTVNRIPMLLGGDKSSVTQMRSTLEEIAGQLNGFMGNDGYDMSTILQQEIAEGMRGIRNSADRTLAASEIMKALVERNLGKSDEPVIETYYEIGSVRLRVVAVNPSGDKSQIVPIKIYLPQEVIPDDIIDMGELQVGFDSARSLYYAFNDGVELAPKETRVFEVHLEDVWRIPDEEMQKVQMQTDRAMKFLTGTEFEEKAREIVDSINVRIEGIKTKQNDQSISREEHIGAYRVNLITMQDIRKDIRILEKVLQHAGAPPSIEFLKDTVFEKKDDIEQSTVWKIILGIVGFLALLGFGFLFRWFIVIQAQRRTQTSAPSDLGAGLDIEDKGSADNRIETIGMPDQSDEPPADEQKKAS